VATIFCTLHRKINYANDEVSMPEKINVANEIKELKELLKDSIINKRRI